MGSPPNNLSLSGFRENEHGEHSSLEYQESIDYLFGLQKYGIKFGLNCTSNLLSRLGNPHHRLRCIHIAGTNGKGSTAAMLSAVLKQHGLRVGLYTSPHLVRFTERFRIDDEEVDPRAYSGGL